MAGDVNIETTDAAEPPVPGMVSIHEGELDYIASVMARRRTEFLAFLQAECRMTKEEALAHGSQLSKKERLTDLDGRPVRNLTWNDFDWVAELDMKVALGKWQELKAQARAEWESGQRGAETMRLSEPWERARYAALLSSFKDEWQPRGGIELALIEQMAQCYSSWLSCLENYLFIDFFDGSEKVDDEEAGYHSRGYVVPPRLSRAQYVDRALHTTERFQRMFLRSLRALRDLRRYTPKITIHNEGQVNIAEQQVNVAK